MEAMIYPSPDEEFCKRLSSFDPYLQLNWDPKAQVWSIWCREEDGSISHVMNVVNEDGSFRPLDDRVFKILRANKYFAQNPRELEQHLVDGIEDHREKQQKFSHDEIRHLSKDKSLQRTFKEAVETARSVPWKEWLQKKVLHDGKGNVLMNHDGTPIHYVPSTSVLETKGKKPTLEELS